MTYILLIFIVLLLTACSTLNNDLITHATDDNQSSSKTAILALSNIALSQLEIDQLAQRTQQQNYIDAFIMHCAANYNERLTKKSQWISIVSPLLKSLGSHALSNDKALKILLKLNSYADDVNLEYITSQINIISTYDNKRVIENRNVEF